MENEDDKMFDLDTEDKKNSNNDVIDSGLLDLKENSEEEVVGLDVVDFDKKKWAYEFDISQKVGVFLDLVLQDLGISNDNHEVHFALKDKILDNDKTLKSYGIQSLDILYLYKEEMISNNNQIGNLPEENVERSSSILSLSRKGMISVIIGDSNNKMEKFDIREDATVQELIDMYKGTVNIQNKATIYLVYRGKILNKEQTLKNCDVTNLSRLNILIRLPGGL